MRLPKILKQFFLSLVITVLPSFVLAQYAYEGEVTITATVSEDTFSTVDVLPITVEIGEVANVLVTIKDNSYLPVPNHYVELVASGLIFTQPSLPSDAQGRITITVYTNTPGTYSICAHDITYSGLVIDILDCATLYVTPVSIPTLISEPIYTKGLSNQVFWNTIGSSYEYFVEVSEYNDFNIVKQSSGWITGTMFEFDNLENGEMYFYRVKARNSYGGESLWSNVVYSVQDNEAPSTSLISISDIVDNNTVEWESNYEIEFVYRVEDNLSLASAEFLCIRGDGSKVVCGDTSLNGSVYTTKLYLNELEKDGLAYLYQDYSFCVLAMDTAGNQFEYCDIHINIPLWAKPDEPSEPDEPKPPAPIPTLIGRVINDVVDTTQVVLEGMFGDLDNYQLENINTTTTVATITVGLGTLLGGIIYIPIYLFELLLGFLSWLGLRKRGKLGGYVYDSETKDPLSQAVVRVYNSEKKLVWTDVTNSRGFFELALDDGIYRLEVTSGNYIFPSKVIFGKADYPLENVYHGEEFVVDEGVIPEFSIPLDSVELSKFRSLFISLVSRTRILFKVLSVVLFAFGLIFSLYTYYVNSNVFNLVIIILYIPSFLLILKALFKKNLEYGVVKDVDGNILGNIAIGLRDVEYKKIVAKRVTDGKGRYRFIVDQGEYNIEVLDTEYEVVSVEEKKVEYLNDGSVLIALDVEVEVIVVEK